MRRQTATEVRLWGETVGFAAWDDRRQCASFQYVPSFIRGGYDVSPAVMPRSSGIYTFDSLGRETFQGLPGMLADSLPDSYGSSLIDIWMRRNGIRQEDFTPLDRLCYIGSRGMGALEYEPMVRTGYKDEMMDIDLLSDLAAEVLDDKKKFSADLSDEGLQELISIGTSAGGARAKAVIGFDESTMGIRSGQVGLPAGYTHWIIKFDTESGSARKGYGRIEHAYYRMAKDCGIEMSECRLIGTGEKAHFLTKRFDRMGDEKVHMQTLCALAHYDFKVPGKYGYENVFSTMRKLDAPYADMEQLFRRMVFNVTMRNNDDHTKNISFLMGKDGRWRLAPAYDLTFAFDGDNYWLRRHQMSVNGKLEHILRQDMTDVAHEMNIRDAADIIDLTLSTASEWEAYAKESGVPEASMRHIGRHISPLS
ncbi:MAG: type II toxin-antitoxin system HipA family toxin [Candidatus Methanomethylophilaceae archaeon]|nr:type II toxin-antitoxin system HipA family toxin [Candidatus Methanomethylophilaceae archaeon]MDD3987213.1 type II toxin-antitoxin system HipA family toxin [Candidatus Methanomethylophilaceae archaeon]MDD4709292.1 type II toxin-antitoxin system HipA family toxin [Candidatus Methanomethylophilaceae archaeon]MDY0252714.1 type II toxin-antitoxin system HipA family toxin [Candidatus Methanomethylophilaceae archaeon]